MDEVRDAIYAIATGTKEYLTRTDNSKYGPIAFKASSFQNLVETGDYEDVLDDNLSDGQYAEIQERDSTKYLVFDTDNIPEKVLLEHSDVFQALHKRCNGFALAHRRGIAKVMNKNNGIVDQVFNRFENKVPSRFLPVLEEAMVLKALEQEQDLHQETVYQWRGEIASKHGDRDNDPEEAQNLISLCSTGYLDEDDVFDEIYSKMVKDGSNTKEEYKALFGKYVSQNPFAVFVQSRGKSIDTICTEARNKLDVIQRWEFSPGFVDVCGKGKGTHKIIKEVRDELEPEFDGKTTIHYNAKIEQLVIRFEPSVI